MKCIIFLCAFAGGTNSIFAFIRPKVPVYLTSVARNPNELPLWVKGCSGIFSTYLYLTQYYLLCLVVCCTMYYTYSVRAILRKLRSSGTKWIEYRAISILQTEYNHVFQDWLVAHVILDVISISLNIYQAVAMHSVRALVVCGMVITSATWTLREYSSVHYDSIAVLQRWKNSGRWRPTWFKKFLRSCKPLKINNGRLFYVDRKLLLTLAAIVVDKTTSMLVLHAT